MAASPVASDLANPHTTFMGWLAKAATECIRQAEDIVNGGIILPPPYGWHFFSTVKG